MLDIHMLLPSMTVKIALGCNPRTFPKKSSPGPSDILVGVVVFLRLTHKNLGTEDSNLLKCPYTVHLLFVSGRKICESTLMECSAEGLSVIELDYGLKEL